MGKSQKRCVYCHTLYTPDRRTARIQKACAKKSCRQKRKAQANTKFARENPTYFRGRYRELKTWLAKNPGYLARYRVDHPEYRRKNRLRERRRRWRRRWGVDMQAAIPRWEIGRLQELHGVDIQDTTRLRLDGLLTLLSTPSGVDIQVPNAIGTPGG